MTIPSEPHWWATGSRTAISRNGFIKRWIAAAKDLPSDRKIFTTELIRWASAAGKHAWVNVAFGDSVAAYATTKPDLPRQDDEAWLEMTRFFATYIDPLARITAQLRDAIEEEVPAGLTKDIRSQIRECARSAGTELGDQLCSSNALGDVLESARTLEEFLEEASERHEELQIAIGQAFLLKVKGYLAASRDTLGDSDRAVLDAWLPAKIGEWGDPGAPPRKPTAAEIAHVEKLLKDEIAAHPRLRTGPKACFLSEAWERARTTLLNWLVKGIKITNARILHKSLRWTELDWLRKQRKRPEISVDPLETPFTDESEVSQPSSKPVDPDTSRAAADWLATYREAGRGARGSWELQIARQLLRSASELPAIESLQRVVAKIWAEQPPADAASATSAQAAGYVIRLMEMALAQQRPTEPNRSEYDRYALIEDLSARTDPPNDDDGQNEENEE